MCVTCFLWWSAKNDPLTLVLLTAHHTPTVSCNGASWINIQNLLSLARAHTKKTGNRNATATYKNFCQAELNTWNWIVPRTPSKLQRNCISTHGKLSNSARRKLNMPVFSTAALHSGCLVSCVCDISRYSDGTKGRRRYYCFCTVNWAGARPLWQPPRYARRDKVDLAWERISHEIKEPGIFWLQLITKSQYRIG